MSDQPRRIQLRRTKGFNLQRESLALNGLPAVKVDRTTVWGNFYKVGATVRHLNGNVILVTSIEHSVELFREWTELWHARYPEYFEELRNKNPACWCDLPKPGEPDICHGTILLGIANPRALK